MKLSNYIVVFFLTLSLFGCTTSEKEVKDILLINDRAFFLLNGNVHTVTTDIYSVDRKGNVLSEAENSKIVIFDREGTLKSESFREGYKVSNKSYLTDELGNRDSVIISLGDNKRLLAKYQVISNKKMKIFQYLNTDTIVDVIETWYFDNSGLLERKETEGIANFQPSSEVFFFYSDGRKSKEVVIAEKGSDLDSTIKYFYQDSIIVNSYFNGFIESKWIETFTKRDDFGNWLKGDKTLIMNNFNDTLKYIINRSITYY